MRASSWSAPMCSPRPKPWSGKQAVRRSWANLFLRSSCCAPSRRQWAALMLNDVDTDALTELFNIGLHRAAASLSDLTSQRVLVDLPRLWVCPLKDLKSVLTE